MYLVAQRVQTPKGEGINSYLHAHGERSDWVWSPPERVPDNEPGTLVNDNVTTKGMGRVRSFLDIAAPDGSTREQVGWAHDGIVALMRSGAVLPLQLTSGTMLVRFEVDFQLQERWHDELHALLDAGLELLA